MCEACYENLAKPVAGAKKADVPGSVVPTSGGVPTAVAAAAGQTAVLSPEEADKQKVTTFTNCFISRFYEKYILSILFFTICRVIIQSF